MIPDTDFIAAMSVGIPTLPKPDGLMSIDCTGIMRGNADLELSDIERIEGITALPPEYWHGL